MGNSRSALALAGLALALASCTRASGPELRSGPAPAGGSPVDPRRSNTQVLGAANAADASLEPLALACDGAGLEAALADRDLKALVSGDAGASVALLARWESTRAFGEDGRIDRSAVEGLAAAVGRQLARDPPTWWIEHLASGRLRAADPAGAPAYDVGYTATGDRRGELIEGPGGVTMRRELAHVLSSTGGRLRYDLSSGPVDMGPAPGGPGVSLEIARGRAGTTLFVAHFDRGAGGFRFPLRAIGPDGQVRWEATVCAPDRKILGGLGHLIVEIVVLEREPDEAAARGVMRPSPGLTGVAVFTAESHGVALDVFDPETGARTLAWSSDLWFWR